MDGFSAIGKSPILIYIGSVTINGMSRSTGRERLFSMKKTTDHVIAEVSCRRSRIGMTIGIDLGDVWSHYCTLNEDGE